MSIEDPTAGRCQPPEPARWQDIQPPAPPPPVPRDNQAAANFPPAAGPLPPRPQPLLQQEPLVPLPHWDMPQPPAAEPWPAPATQAQALPLRTEPSSPQPRVPNLLIERQLRVISTSEAYSQGYSDPAGHGFGLPFPPLDQSGEVVSAAASRPHQTPAPPASAASRPDRLDAQQQRIQELEKELAAAQGEVQALSEMLDDLPAIFERKFHQRLQGVLDQQRLLMAENSSLRDRLFGLLPGAAPDQANSRELLLPPVAGPQRSRLGDRLRRALGWSSRRESQAQGRPAGQEDLSRPDDGRPRVA